MQHNNFSFRSAADSHGDSMKAKLQSLRPLDRSPTRPLLSDISPREPRLGTSHTLPVQLPIHSRERGLSDARESSFSNYRHNDSRSPIDGSDMDFTSPRTRSRRNTGDENNSYDYHNAEDMDMEETGSLTRLHINESHSAAGHKRRAASPPDEYGPVGLADAMRRREAAARSSAAARLAPISQGSSLSPSSTAPPSRSNSYLSTLSIPASQSSVAGYSHRSPVALSSNGVSPASATSPYASTTPLNPSPRGSISRGPVHSRVPSTSMNRKTAEAGGKASVTKLQGFYMCDCCPKKPKKFDSAEELAYVIHQPPRQTVQQNQPD